ncbi:hypothetical protein ACFV2Q_33355 [Streptomyces sp. NPDC059650]|uniref:hypothetical protein n=1 Tax=Streptomyces sp. NPDC059650 TaxID=3346896 RepID=UPI0036A2BFED
MTAIPPAGPNKRLAPHDPHPFPDPDVYGPFGRVVTAPASSAKPTPPNWVTWLLFMVPLCIAEMRNLSELEFKRVSARAADLIASHGDDAQYGGHHQGSARTAIAKGLAALARAEGGVTALGIHACVRPHLDCPGSPTTHSGSSKSEEQDA